MILKPIIILHNTRGTSNKVWGILKENDRQFYAFWGGIGKKFQFQEFSHDYWDRKSMITSKEKKGYREITEDRLVELQPDFDKQLFAIVLGDGAKAKSGYTSDRRRQEEKNKEETSLFVTGG